MKRSECCLGQDSSLLVTSNTGKSLWPLVVSTEFLVLVWRQPVAGYSRMSGWSGRPAANTLPGGEKWRVVCPACCQAKLWGQGKAFGFRM